MAVIRVENVTKYFGELFLFKNISFSINHADKVALVANNGTGKSTLISLITGEDVPFSGTIDIMPGCKIGLLDQTPLLDSNKTIYDEVYNSNQHIIELISAYNSALANKDIESIEKLTGQMEALEAWSYESEVNYMISLMKLPNKDTLISILSGGQKKRIALAKLLLQKPDLLILDEPTNHLDIEIIEWLEGFLSASNTTLLMVTHDRYFLDRVCSSIIELTDGVAYTYQGNYSYYLEKKQEREEVQKAERAKAQNLLRTELEWMRRQPKARSTKAKYRVDAFYDLQKRAKDTSSQSNIDITVEAKRLGNKIIEVSDVSKSYDNTHLFSSFSYVFNKGDKIGIIGKNGCGKSTLLQIITKQIIPDSGLVEYGETVEIGYFKQDGLQVSPTKKVIEVISDISERISLGKNNELSPAQFLEQWLFPRPMHHLRVEKLSGGERKRLYLMTVLMKQPNFLILDEPTNDLDLPTIHLLEEYLLAFEGCVLLVSHDRFFTDKVVQQLFVFSESEPIKVFPGNYSNYKEYTDYLKEQEQKISASAAHVERSKQKTEQKKQKKGLIYKERLELEALEKEIEELETAKNELETLLQTESSNSEKLLEISEKIGQVIEQLENKELRWLELSEKAEE